MKSLIAFLAVLILLVPVQVFACTPTPTPTPKPSPTPIPTPCNNNQNTNTNNNQNSANSSSQSDADATAIAIANGGTGGNATGGNATATGGNATANGGQGGQGGQGGAGGNADVTNSGNSTNNITVNPENNTTVNNNPTQNNELNSTMSNAQQQYNNQVANTGDVNSVIKNNLNFSYNEARQFLAPPQPSQAQLPDSNLGPQEPWNVTENLPSYIDVFDYRKSQVDSASYNAVTKRVSNKKMDRVWICPPGEKTKRVYERAPSNLVIGIQGYIFVRMKPGSNTIEALKCAASLAANNGCRAMLNVRTGYLVIDRRTGKASPFTVGLSKLFGTVGVSASVSPFNKIKGASYMVFVPWVKAEVISARKKE